MGLIRKVLIVGGGTSGWLTACMLARRFSGDADNPLEVTLIEASDIPTIGVGEATIPPILTPMSQLGMDEATFMRKCNATFKLEIRFVDWMKADEKSPDDPHWYYHAFGQLGYVGPPQARENIAPYWLMEGRQSGISLVDYAMLEGRICDAMRAPKRLHDQDFGGPLQYAYHFDAGLVAEVMKEAGKKAGVRHLIGNVKKVNLADNGSISDVETEEHGTLEADLYVDCTGFAALLIEKALGSEFTSFGDTLFCDEAIACQAPYESEDAPIPPYTRATAQKAGWIWDIPLSHRRGAGHVYSSKYMDADKAEEILADYLGPVAKDVSLQRLKMRVGCRQEQWRKNCVSIGLAGGFVEPLESTGIYLADIAIRRLTTYLTTTEDMPIAAKLFNQEMGEAYADVVDFIKLHLALSDRDDSDFWRDNRNKKTVPDSLLDRLALWSHRVPTDLEFVSNTAIFGLPNYLQVMYGMGHYPEVDSLRRRHQNLKAARAKTESMRKASLYGVKDLPDHRGLIEQLKKGPFRPDLNPQLRRHQAGQVKFQN